MFLVGLTGGIGSGKSTVSRIIRKSGYPVIDADELSHRVSEPGQPAYDKLRQSFGDAYFFADGRLDRKKLGQLVFADQKQRKKLNSIIHPYVRSEMLKAIFAYAIRCYPFVILDCPLLFETGGNRFVSKTIVVYCSPENQLKRLLDRDACSEADATSRISAQIPLEKKLWGANFVVENDGDVATAMEQTLKILTELRNSKLHWFYRILAFGLFAVVAFALFKVCQKVFF